MTDEALDLKIGFPTGSFCLALLANVLPATPGDLERWWVVECFLAQGSLGLYLDVARLPPSAYVLMPGEFTLVATFHAGLLSMGLSLREDIHRGRFSS